MARCKVYVTDYEYESLELEKAALRRCDAELIALQCRTEQDVLDACANADALLVQYAPITRRVLDGLRRLKVIVRYGVGVDCVDLDAATEHDIAVCNVADYGVDEVSDHAMALILACVRKIQPLSDDVRKGIWDFNRARPIRRMNTMTLGLAGFGRNAREVARKAKPFGFSLIACDPFIGSDAFEAEGVRSVDFSTLLRLADVISIHMPLTSDTFHNFDAAAFSAMKQGSYLVNTSRGALIDEAALCEAIGRGVLAGAGLDVCEHEPLEEKSGLRALTNVILTPHAAWYSEQAQADLQRKAGEEVARVLKGEQPRSRVNRAP